MKSFLTVIAIAMSLIAMPAMAASKGHKSGAKPKTSAKAHVAKAKSYKKSY